MLKILFLTLCFSADELNVLERDSDINRIARQLTETLNDRGLLLHTVQTDFVFNHWENTHGEVVAMISCTFVRFDFDSELLFKANYFAVPIDPMDPDIVIHAATACDMWFPNPDREKK